MKVLNLQDYQKDKAIENLKRDIDDLTIDNGTKAILNGLLDINMINFKIEQDLANHIKEIFKTLTLLLENRIKPIEETLFKDVASYTKNIMEIIKQQKEEISDLKLRIATLESKIS